MCTKKLNSILISCGLYKVFFIIWNNESCSIKQGKSRQMSSMLHNPKCTHAWTSAAGSKQLDINSINHSNWSCNYAHSHMRLFNKCLLHTEHEVNQNCKGHFIWDIQCSCYFNRNTGAAFWTDLFHIHT